MGDFSLDLKALLTITAIITTIVIAYTANWRRNRKSLSYQTISNVVLLNTAEIIREKLQILYEGMPVKNVRLLLLKIINDGFQPIDEKDFKKTLDFVFTEEAQILSAEIQSVNPENLDISFTFENNKLSIKPILLNSKDFIEIKFIVSTYESILKCDARIVGVKEIKHFSPNRVALKRFYGFLMILPLILIIVGIYLLPTTIGFVIIFSALLTALTMWWEAKDFDDKFRKIDEGKGYYFE
jgi:hypothetical protein